MSKIRILYIVDNLMISNGVSTVIMNYCRKINKKDFKIELYVLKRIEDNTYEEELNRINIAIYYSQHPYSFFHLNKLKEEFKMFLKKHKYDIVESHLPSLSYLLMNYYNFNNREIRIIHTHSSIMSSNFIKNIINIVLNYNIKKNADYYFGCSIDSGRYWFGNKIVESNKFYVIHNGTDKTKYYYNVKIREKLRKSFDIEDKVVIGFVGRISKDKNLEFIINVMNELTNFNVLLFLIGSKSNNYDKVIKLIKDKDNIKYLGFRNDINELYNMFDALVLCSKREGLPMVVVEAQLNQLQCFLSNTITREVDIGLCRYLPLNKEIWVNEFQNIIIDNNRNNVINNDTYNIDNNVKEIENIYKMIVSNR